MNLLQWQPSPGKLVDWLSLEKDWDLVQGMRETPQDKAHHTEGDVWTHTKLVVNALTTHPWWGELDDTGRRITFLGALLHDIGKPATTVHEPDGRITSIGHSRRGAMDARLLLWRTHLPFEERENVCSIIMGHQYPFYILQKEDARDRLLQLSRTTRMDWLGCVAMADAVGRQTTPASNWQITVDNVELYRLACEEYNIWGQSFMPADEYTWQKYKRAPTQCDPNYTIQRVNQGSRVILMSGLPGMGKDTWIKKYASQMPVLSYDDMREHMGVKHGESTGEVVHAVWEQARVLLRQKAAFVWNATHLSPNMRQKALDLLWNYDADVTVTYIENSQETQWRKQNNGRGDKAVPNKALDQLLFKWEPPSPDEAEHVEYWINNEKLIPTHRNIGQSQNPDLYSLS